MRERERERRERESERERASVCLCASGRRIGGCKHSLIIREEGGGVGGRGRQRKNRKRKFPAVRTSVCKR